MTAADAGAPAPASRLGRLRAWLVPLVLVLMATLVAHNVMREDALREEAKRANEARVALQALFSTLQDGEIGERGYVLTGDRAFLQPYTDARSAWPRRETAAETLLLSGPNRPEEIRHLHDLAVRRFALLAERVSTFDARGRDATAALVAKGEGKRVMDEFRRVTAQLSAREVREFDARLAARLATRRLVNGLGAAVLLGALVVIILAQRRDVRHDRQRALLVQQLHEQASRTTAIFESAMDAIVTLNPSGSIESVNEAGERMFGYVRDDLLRRDVSVLAEVARQGFGTFHQRLQAGGAAVETGMVRELVAQRKDGSSFPVDVALRGMPLPDGLHVVAIVRDISERRRVEAMKEEFTATVSHELRTPLTSIVGALGLLKGGAGGVLPERAARLVQIAEANGTRLVRLINDILDLEKFSSGQASFAFAPQSLNDLTARAVEMMTGLGDERRVPVTMTPAALDPVVRADADRVLQVLANLLSNAVKYSPVEAAVEVRVEAGVDRASVVIVDRGPGVPEAFQHRLFQKFAQADGSDARRHGGTGLGLAISREITEMHGGTLGFAPTPGGGATFRLDLPLSAEIVPKDEGRAKRLLVCEDDALTAEMIRSELQELGFEVDLAGGANEARQAVHTRRYAALLLDLGLPDADGLTLVRALRAAPATRDLPVIIVSGSLDRDGEGRMLDVIDWIEKPVAIPRLRAALHTALSRAHRPAPMILHVDDDQDLLEVARGVLGGAGEVVAATSLSEARRVLSQRTPDVVVLDLGLPDGSGADLVPELTRDDGGSIPIIVYTAQEPSRALDERVVSVFTKSRVGLQRLADRVRIITDRSGRDGEQA